jgi:hypothetical protein
LAYWEPAQQVGVIDSMSGQNVIDHLIDFGQLYTPVYEEVQYEAQVAHLRHSKFIELREDKHPKDVVKE